MLDQKNGKAIWVVFAVVLLAVGLACGALGPPSEPAQPSGETLVPKETQSPAVEPTWPPTWTPTGSPTPTYTPMPVPPTPIPPTATPMNIVSDDCGDAVGSLIKAADDCSPASVTCSASTNVFGAVMTMTMLYEIRGMEADACVAYMRVEDASVRFTEEGIQWRLESGATLEEIRQDEVEANLALDEMEGKDGVCRFGSTESLKEWLRVLERQFLYGTSCVLEDGEWKCGYEGDYECEGDLFETAVEW